MSRSDELLTRAIQIIRAAFPRHYPENIMGACAECATDKPGVHRANCKWARARRWLEDASDA